MHYMFSEVIRKPYTKLLVIGMAGFFAEFYLFYSRRFRKMSSAEQKKKYPILAYLQNTKENYLLTFGLLLVVIFLIHF